MKPSEPRDNANVVVAFVLGAALFFAFDAPSREGRIEILIAVITLGIFWICVDRLTR